MCLLIHLGLYDRRKTDDDDRASAIVRELDISHRLLFTHVEDSAVLQHVEENDVTKTAFFVGQSGPI